MGQRGDIPLQALFTNDAGRLNCKRLWLAIMLILDFTVYADRHFQFSIAFMASSICGCGVDCRAGAYWGVTALSSIKAHRIPHLYGRLTVLYRDYSVIYGNIRYHTVQIR